MYVLLGSNGNITAKAARRLLSQGRPVRVVGRSRSNLDPLRRAGAEVAVGDLTDTEFLRYAMRGAEALYAMLPPLYAAPAPLDEYARVGEAIAKAIGEAGVKRVVNLSSIGGQLAAGTGPIAALHAQEQRLNVLPGVQILHLRPGYFFENHLNAIGLIKAFGIYSDLIDPSVALPSIATADIAAVLARELVTPGTGSEKAVLHLRGPGHYTQPEAAAILGKAIGKPDLRYVRADPQQAKAGMIQHGISPNMADLFEEMSEAFARPEFTEGLLAGPTEVTPTSLEQFAPAFKAAYESCASSLAAA